MNNSITKLWIRDIFNTVKTPTLFFLCCYALYLTRYLLKIEYSHLQFVNKNHVEELYNIFFDLTQLIYIYWLILNVFQSIINYLTQWASANKYTTFLIFLPSIASSLHAVGFIIMLNVLIPTFKLEGIAELIIERVAKIIFIVIAFHMLVKILNAMEQYIINHYIKNNLNSYDSRKINTQLTILKRVLLVFIGVVIFSSILMVFDSARNIGASILTTAGILSAAGAFASQKSLSRLFSGLQIAFTQPFRIGDSVIIDNEFGEVEEITLSFIVVKLWDLRRLVLPTDYFENKGLLNLTRHSTQLLGTIFLYVDYELPMEATRKKFYSLMRSSLFWDKKVSECEVTNISENAMEIRCLVSAANTSNLWKLRCEIREKLIKFIVDDYPFCLAKKRTGVSEVRREAENELVQS